MRVFIASTVVELFIKFCYSIDLGAAMHSLFVVLFGLAVLFSAQLHLSIQQYTLIFDRQEPVDVIALSCRNGTDSPKINVEENMSLRFYVNLTRGDVSGSRDLEELLRDRNLGELTRSGTQATFKITQVIEGYYSCASIGTLPIMDQPLICKFVVYAFARA